MPTHFMVELMEQTSHASKVDVMKIELTSLVGVKSFNLMNKAESLVHLHLLKQIPLLTNLKALEICPHRAFESFPVRKYWYHRKE